jgi:endonuclease/exonuclease/phosphatase family metal-dependent hydrolase
LRHGRDGCDDGEMTRGTPAALALCILLGAGCKTAQNYLDPAGPVYRGASASVASGDPDIRVVTFNIAYGLEVDRAIAALTRHPALRDADLVALQEMDAPGVEAIARALYMNYVYYPVSLSPKYGRDFGNALLSPWPIEDTRKVLLPHTSRIVKQGRAAVAARVRIADRTFQVYSVHLGSPFGTSPGNRRRQAEVVLADARSFEGPVIVAGDFNSHGLGERFLAEGFAWPTRHVGASVRGFSYDHIFVRGLRVAGTEAGVARDVKDASDHRPVWAELHLAEPSSSTAESAASLAGNPRLGPVPFPGWRTARGRNRGEEATQLLFVEPAARAHPGADVQGERPDDVDRFREVLRP